MSQGRHNLFVLLDIVVTGQGSQYLYNHFVAILGAEHKTKVPIMAKQKMERTQILDDGNEMLN